jgi:hypothetical protein
MLRRGVQKLVNISEDPTGTIFMIEETDPEYGRSKFLWKASKLLPDFTAFRPISSPPHGYCPITAHGLYTHNV